MSTTAQRNKSDRKAAKAAVTLQMAPMQWAALRDIDDVAPIHEGDYACLAEVRDVLTKHNKRDRFGV